MSQPAYLKKQETITHPCTFPQQPTSVNTDIMFKKKNSNKSHSSAVIITKQSHPTVQDLYLMARSQVTHQADLGPVQLGEGQAAHAEA